MADTRPESFPEAHVVVMFVQPAKVLCLHIRLTGMLVYYNCPICLDILHEACSFTHQRTNTLRSFTVSWSGIGAARYKPETENPTTRVCIMQYIGMRKGYYVSGG